VARIVLGSYMVRYPLGGNLSWALQYLVGLERLGHDVYFVEKSGYPNSCYDPSADRMSDDCSYGVSTVGALLTRHGLGDRWCYVDAAGRYYGMSEARTTDVFSSADAFVDMGTHGSWLNEASVCPIRAFVDAEPGMRQMRMQKTIDEGGKLPEYDFYFTKGQNIPIGHATAPDAGCVWRGMFHPVITDLFPVVPCPPDARFSTVMNWQSYERIEYRGATFGHKDLEFEKFITLPLRTSAAFEIAVSGQKTPVRRLAEHGWRMKDAHYITRSVESCVSYIQGSRGEFSVCKNGFVATR
jgi:hypothetical protein